MLTEMLAKRDCQQTMLLSGHVYLNSSTAYSASKEGTWYHPESQVQSQVQCADLARSPKKQEIQLSYILDFQLRRQRKPQLIIHDPALILRIGNYIYVCDQTQSIRVFIHLQGPLCVCLLRDKTEDIW